MGRFMNALNTLGEVVDAHHERSLKVDDMTRELTRRAYGVDPIEARKIAAVLVDRAEVNWK